MGDALNIAGAANGYVLSDRGTWIHFKNTETRRHSEAESDPSRHLAARVGGNAACGVLHAADPAGRGAFKAPDKRGPRD